MTFYADAAGSVDGQTGTAGELIPSVSIEAMLQRREALHGIMEQIGKLLRQADELGAAGGFGGLSDYAEPGRNYGPARANLITEEGRQIVRTALDAQGWRHLLNESGIRSFMSAKKREEWDEAISKLKVPPLNRETIAGTFADLYENRGAMLEQGVVEVFRCLSWNYKTNKPEAFGKKIIRAHAVQWGSPSHRFSNELDDLLRIMFKLDGRPEADHRRGSYVGLSAAMKAGEAYVDDYVSVTLYRNACTAHVTFRRPDLVDRMNGILAKHYGNALPPARN